MQMAQQGGLRVIEGTITLEQNQSSITINIPFKPRLFLLNLRAMQPSDTSYHTFFEVGAFFNNTENVNVAPIGTTGGINYEFDGSYNSTSRGTFLPLPTYGDGVFTLSPRSAAQNFAKGTYDYIFVE